MKMKTFLLIFCISALSFADIKAEGQSTIQNAIENRSENGEILYVYLSNGDVDAYQISDIDGEYYTENGRLYIPLKEDVVYSYANDEYDSYTTVKPQLPTMTSFCFKNKYNHNLHIDATADPVEEEMHFSLNAIGKWLTASFTLSDEKAVAYVDTVLQTSDATRQSFKKKVTYCVTYPGYHIIKKVKVQDEIWSTPSAGPTVTDVELSAGMLATNKPSVEPNESLANLLDGDPNTIFHSTWGDANNETLNVYAYITIDLPEKLDKFQIYYRCRPQTGYNPRAWEIYASNDGTNWTPIRTLDYYSDNMPTGGSGQEYTSPTIDLNGEYSKLKILQTSGEYSKNHLVLSELRIKKVIENNGGEPEKIQDAIYAIKRVPYGNEYAINVDWLTDNPDAIPRIDIDIEGGNFVTDAYKEIYQNARFRISGNGVYEDMDDSLQIKGRGNSSWSQDKKPYRLKFDKKKSPFGLTKGKSWVLLANAQAGSLMANAITMKIGQMAGTEFVNHIVPVELYMNGRYMGSYMFTEKVGIAGNNVDIDEDEGYLLEMDDYYDEDYKFRDNYFSLPVNVKDPDLSDYTADVTNSRLNKIKEQVNSLCQAVYSGNNIESKLDMDALARFMLANDFSLNQELGHPKSTYLFMENENDPDSKFKFGPIWDFDWGFGYESTRSYCESGAKADVLNTSMSYEAGYRFFTNIRNSAVFKKYYYKVWKEFINNNSMEELMDYIDSYYTFAEKSFINNSYEWGYSCGFTAEDKERHKSWLEERKDFIYNNLEKSNIDDLLYAITGDVNCNNQLTIHDVALITAHLNGNTHKTLNTSKADCDKNGKIDIDDARIAETSVRESDAPSAAYWYDTPFAAAELYSGDYVMEMGEALEIELGMLCRGEEQYKAIQFDINLPVNTELTYSFNEASVNQHNPSFAEIGENCYRFMAYSDNDAQFTTGDDKLLALTINSTEIVNEEESNIEISNIYVVDNNNNELRLKDHNIKFKQTTGIGYIGATALIEGGDCITITLLKAQEITVYAVDGRKIRSINAKEGTTRISLPAGIYIVNGEKVIIR